jgi:hypothetical protein
MQNYLIKLAQRHPDLRIFSDDVQTRISFPIATDQLVFMRTPEPRQRPIGELFEIVEGTIGGKFQLPVKTSPEKALEPASGRTAQPCGMAPLASIEIWSLEPGCYDLVLKLPRETLTDQTLGAPLINRFIDQAKEISRVIDTTDLLRFQSGPALSIREAQNRLSSLEKESGTRLDAENLIQLMETPGKHKLN